MADEKTGSEALFGIFDGKGSPPLPPIRLIKRPAGLPCVPPLRVGQKGPGSIEPFVDSHLPKAKPYMAERDRQILELWNAGENQEGVAAKTGASISALNMVLVGWRKKGVAVRTRGKPWPPGADAEGKAPPLADIVERDLELVADRGMKQALEDAELEERDARRAEPVVLGPPPPSPARRVSTPVRMPRPGPTASSMGELVDNLITPATMLLSLKRRKEELRRIVAAAESAAAELPKIETAIAALEPLAETQYRCKSCEAKWRLHRVGEPAAWTWSLWDGGQRPGPCCDNSPDFIQLLDPRPPPEAMKPAVWIDEPDDEDRGTEAWDGANEGFVR